MKLLGQCEVQCASNFLSSKKLVLRTDRDRGDNPFIRFYSNETNSNLVIRIFNTIRIENMISNSEKGDKDRTDIYFNEIQLDLIINILSPFIDSLSITFNDSPRRTPNPTGMEYPGGLPLSIKENITNIPARLLANYAEKDFTVEASLIYIEFEKPKKGNRFHIGAKMNKTILDKANGINSFELFIDYSHLKRFLQSMNIVKKLFNQT
jgi:hypothetical protein